MLNMVITTNVVRAMKQNRSAVATSKWWCRRMSWWAHLSTQPSTRHHHHGRRAVVVVLPAARRPLNADLSSCGSSSEICSSCRSATTPESAGSTAIQVKRSFYVTVLSTPYIHQAGTVRYSFRSEWYRTSNNSGILLIHFLVLLLIFDNPSHP